MASARTREQNIAHGLAVLDAMLGKTKVIVTSVDKRLLRLSSPLAVSLCNSRGSGTSEAGSEERPATPSTAGPSDDPEPASSEKPKTSKPRTAHAKKKTSQTSGAQPMQWQMTPECFLGNWIDSDGNAVQVAAAEHLLVTISRPPLRQLQLELWQPKDGSWRCGDAVLDASCSAGGQLTWHFQGGRVSVWMRQGKLWDQSEGDVDWLSVWEPDFGYGPWAPGSWPLAAHESVGDPARPWAPGIWPSAHESVGDPARPGTKLHEARPGLAGMSELAFELSGGATNVMLMAQAGKDGQIILMPATEGDFSAHASKVEKAPEINLTEEEFPALRR